MEEKAYEVNDEVIRQGDLGDCLYVVDSGELNTFKRFVQLYLLKLTEQTR